MKRTVFKENQITRRQYQNEKITDPDRAFLLFKNNRSGLLNYYIITDMDFHFTLDEYDEVFNKSSILEITWGERYCTVEIEYEYLNEEYYIHLHFEEDNYEIEEDDFYVIEE